MARKIVWSQEALDDRKSILEYWEIRNKSKNYSRKLYKIFNEYLELIVTFPNFGRATQIENVRYKIVDENYAIIYNILPNEILVISIWDNRNDPAKMKVQKK